MRLQSLTSLILLSYVYIFSAHSVYASPYTAWLNNFQQKLNVGIAIDAEESRDLEEDLSVLPEGEGVDYDSWINLLRQKLQYGPDLSSTEKRILEYVIKAKPKNNGSRYLSFLNLLVQQINGVGALLDASEKQAFHFIQRAKTEGIPSPDFDRFQIEWQNKYQNFKNRFRTLDSSESLLMQYILQAKPIKRTVTLDDPIQQSIRVLFVNSPSVIANTIASNDYQLGSRMVEVIEAFYFTLKRDTERTNDPKLQALLDRVEKLGS